MQLGGTYLFGSFDVAMRVVRVNSPLFDQNSTKLSHVSTLSFLLPRDRKGRLNFLCAAFSFQTSLKSIMTSFWQTSVSLPKANPNLDRKCNSNQPSAIKPNVRNNVETRPFHKILWAEMSCWRKTLKPDRFTKSFGPKCLVKKNLETRPFHKILWAEMSCEEKPWNQTVSQNPLGWNVVCEE